MENAVALIPELSPQTYLNPATSLTAFEKEDLNFLQENKERATRMNLRQFRYIKFLDQRCKKKCLLKQLPNFSEVNEFGKLSICLLKQLPNISEQIEFGKLSIC